MTEPISDLAGSDWIQTASGRAFWPLRPRVEDVDLGDIGHALGNLCRYNGHTRAFYSVAQHCVIMSDVVPDVPGMRLAALFHDAAEAYCSDVARPLKVHMGRYREIEDAVQRVIHERFGIPWPLPAAIKEADLRMLSTERRDLMATPPRPWMTCEGFPPYDVTITPWDPWEAGKLWLDAARALLP